MLKAHKDLLRALVTRLRQSLAGSWDATGAPLRGDLDRELERIGIDPDGTLRPLDALPLATDHDRRAHQVAAAHLAHLPADARAAARAELVERAAYTWINRLLALRTMEARGLMAETLRANPDYEGSSETLYLLRYEQPARCSGPDGGWWAVIDDACAEQARRLPGLFDPADPAAALRPSTPALMAARQALGNPGLDPVFADPDAISWAYQFYQEEAKARVRAKLGRGGKIETRSEIAADTQLFTEPYMVQWLLQNSLGRSYHEAYPDSALPATWTYYIDRARIPGTDAKPPRPAAFTLDELTLLDPCAGSGHFLRAAFDLLFAMFREQQPQLGARSIADRILAHHLYGIDIDPRALQLAGISLVLRAGETLAQHGDRVPYTPPALNLATTPDRLDPAALAHHLARHPEDAVYRPILEGVFAALAQAPILGSLLQPAEQLDAAIQAFRRQGRRDQPALLSEDAATQALLAELAQHDPHELQKLLLARIARSFAREAQASDVAAQLLGRAAGEGVHLLQLLDRRYAVVATNPPYMSSSSMDLPLREYVRQKYEPGRQDLYTAFILRCRSLCRPYGFFSMITQQGWMFQRTYYEMRALAEEHLSDAKKNRKFLGMLREASIESIGHLGPGAFEEIGGEVVQTAMFCARNQPPLNDATISVIRVVGLDGASEKAHGLKEMPAALCYEVPQKTLLLLDRAPFSYWAPKALMGAIRDTRRLDDLAVSIAGLITGDAQRYIRKNWEVPYGSGFIAIANGGGYKRWRGYETDCVRWSPNYREVFNATRNEEYYFGTGIYLTQSASGSLGARLHTGYTFSGNCLGVFCAPDSDSINSLLTALNTYTASFIVRLSVQKMGIEPKHLSAIPIPDTLASGLQGVTDVLLATAQLLKVDMDITESRVLPLIEKASALQQPLGCLIGTLESFVERVYLQLLGIEQDAGSIFAETGTPAGWHPLLAGYDSLPPLPVDLGLPPLPPAVLDHLAQHPRLSPDPAELARIRANLHTLYAAGPGAKSADLDLDELDHHDDDEGVAGAYIPIPTETFLEELSVSLQLHPISVYWLLEELRAAGVRCLPEERRLLEDRLTVIVLRLLGHRWPKQIEAGEPVPEWADRDGVIPLTPGCGEATLATRLRERLREEGGDLAAQQSEALLHELTGRTLEEWLRREFFKRHISQFKKRPIAWLLTSDPTAAGRKRSAEPAFACLVYYHRTGGDILARIRTQYVERLLAPAQRELAQARRDRDEGAAARAAALIQELEEFAQRLRRVEDEGFACAELDAALADEPLDRWLGDGLVAPPNRDDLLAVERAWQVDINDGVRVNVAPLQAAGLLAQDVLARKELAKAIADRARWRSDERRWVRDGKLPRCGWMDASIPASPAWTVRAPEREAERQRLQEKRQKVLAELGS